MKNFILFFLLFHISIFAQDVYMLDVNQIALPFDNAGILGDVIVDDNLAGGRFYENQKIFIYSAGFFLSGKNNDTIWTNAAASAERIQDYQPGNVDSLPTDPKYKLYILKTTDGDFRKSWLDWKEAVKLGADFYDGDGDGIYNPVDLNGNNQWDPNEDRPDLVGDLTAWCVYNDGIPSDMRTFNEVKPLEIEIHQTLFAFIGDNSGYDGRDFTFFVRYKIINTGSVNNSFDSVYFGGWSDTDLGDINEAYFDDLAGCDTISNSGFVYNDGEDGDWGINPPAHFIKILQGPYSFIPGETFLDNNSNGEYEEDIDTPLDTAFNYKGLTGIDAIAGAKNLGLTSFMNYLKGSRDHGNPENQIEARNYLQGKLINGSLIDPCNWIFGNAYGEVNCEDINPIFVYSGDPVTNYGWLTTFPYDQRQLVNTGPFKLEVGKPVSIIIAHIAGRGYDHLNSITKARAYSSSMDGFLKSNFIDIIVSVDDEVVESVPSSFQLYQNYPNPFNPVTTIKYSLPLVETHRDAPLQVSLKVYDVLGKDVATLVNEEQSAGNYELTFNGSNLSSGIYFYRLQTDQFSSVRKMILLK